MAKRQHAPPFAAAFRLNDLEQVSSAFAGWQGQIEQISSGRFEGEFQLAWGGLIRIIDIQGSPNLRVRGHDTSGLVSVYPVTPGNSATGVWQGRKIDPGRIVFHGIHSEVDHTSGRCGGARGLVVNPEVLEEATRSILRTDSADLPKSWTTFAPPHDAFHDLNARLMHLLGRATADPSVLESPERRQHEQECIRALVMALFAPGAQRLDLPLSARSQLIRRAEELMRSSLSGELGSIDLCRELGVSDRTLRLAFQERFGLGPMTYYKSLRLNAVRFRLRTEPSVTVAAAAREFGFHHLGNFAADFRRLFGMRPSEVDRRSWNRSPVTPVD